MSICLPAKCRCTFSRGTNCCKLLDRATSILMMCHRGSRRPLLLLNLPAAVKSIVDCHQAFSTVRRAKHERAELLCGPSEGQAEASRGPEPHEQTGGQGEDIPIAVPVSASMQIFVRLDGSTHVLDTTADDSLHTLSLQLQERCGQPLHEAYLQHAGGLASLAEPASLAELGITDEATLTVCFRLLGGKGGFGALLRGAGRAAATDNFDAYRDLSGRRLRHVHADERLRNWAKQSKDMQRQLQELKRLKDEEKASQNAAIAEADMYAVREAQRAAMAGILSTMEEHFARGTKRSASPAPQQQPQKRSKLLDLGDMDFGSDASSDDESDSDFFESMVLPEGKTAPAEQPAAPQGSSGSEASAAEAQAPLPEKPEAAAPVHRAGAELAAPQQPAAEASAPDPGAGSAAEPLDVSSFPDQAGLEALGGDALKAQLQLRGLKCGGTVSQRAARLFLLKSTPLDNLDAKHFAAQTGKGSR